MANLTGNRLHGLFYKSVDWYCEIGQFALNGLKEMKNFNMILISNYTRNAVKRLSKIFLSCFTQSCVSEKLSIFILTKVIMKMPIDSVIIIIIIIIIINIL